MELDETISEVLSSFGLDKDNFSIQRIDSGHINYTYKLLPGYILQRINKNVFPKPEILARNLNLAAQYLKRTAPDYLFVTSIEDKQTRDFVIDKAGYAWRLFPFIKDTVAIDEVSNEEQAFEAARAFGELSKHLSTCELSKFGVPISQFHDLSNRYSQFGSAHSGASAERREQCQELCNGYVRHKYLVKEYEDLIQSNQLVLRITHNDTKINNVLFQEGSNKVMCVIDLDTLMPGYFIYDLGDMIRTFVSPVSEEETDFSKIEVRKEIHTAVLVGYLSQMNEVLSLNEKKAIPFAGPMMTYMIGLRFLTDYLNGDIYYKTTYSEQNLNRARNQFHLLEKLLELDR